MTGRKRMTNYERIKNMSVDDLAKWLDEYGKFDDSPWNEWFNNTYCKKCKPIKVNREVSEDKLGIHTMYFDGTVECAYCELNKKCKYFESLDNLPSNLDIIEVWLNEKAKRIFTAEEEEPCCAFCCHDDGVNFCKGCGPGTKWEKYERIEE